MDVGAFGPIGDAAEGAACVLLRLGCDLIPLWLLLGRGVHWSRCLHRTFMRDIRAVAADERVGDMEVGCVIVILLGETKSTTLTL